MTTLKKHPTLMAIGAASSLLAAPMLFAHDDHHHDDEHHHDDHHHHTVYIDEGEVDLAIFYHADEGKLEWLIFADEHDHDHDDHDDHDHDHDDHDHDHEHGDHDHHGHEHAHHEDDDHDHDDHDHDHDDHDDHDHDHEHHHGEGIEPDDAVIIAGASAQQTVPENPDFSFLGQPGATVWVLPQDPTAGPAAPGFEFEIHNDIFTDDTITIQLVDVHGPGEFALYVVDSFGDPIVYMNTRDGISDEDRYQGLAETHVHLAWAFSEPGIYKVSFNASGTLIDGGTLIESGATTFTFQVGEALDYLREVEAYENGWADVEGMGWVYTDSFPWIWSTIIDWLYASGPGGETMYLYADTIADWLYTNPDTFPWCYRFSDDDWIYVEETPDGGTWYWSVDNGQWQPW